LETKPIAFYQQEATSGHPGSATLTTLTVNLSAS
jgi:hypothetical protein